MAKKGEEEAGTSLNLRIVMEAILEISHKQDKLNEKVDALIARLPDKDNNAVAGNIIQNNNVVVQKVYFKI